MLQNYENLKKVPYPFESVVFKHPETRDLISIIIPIYNGELYLREALDSVISQTIENWEVILVDDGSTDKTSEICVEYAKKDSRFNYIYKSNEGVLLARKTGLENTMGEFIASLDSDDVYHPQFLEKMFAKIKENNSDFVWCNYGDYSMKVKVQSAEYIRLSENKLENCYNINKFRRPLWNKLIKRNVFAKVLFPQYVIALGEDFMMTIQIIYHSRKAEFISDSLYLYRMDSVTSASLSFNVLTIEKHMIHHISYSIAIYLLMEYFFGTGEAEKFLANKLVSFECYFLLDKKVIKRNNIEYAENFVPAFLNGLKKLKNKNIHRTISVLAYKGFPLPFKIYYKLRKIKEKLCCVNG